MWFARKDPNGLLIMRQLVNVNPTSEHGLFLRLFVTNGAGS
jgi:hypothetical protein